MIPTQLNISCTFRVPRLSHFFHSSWSYFYIHITYLLVFQVARLPSCRANRVVGSDRGISTSMMQPAIFPTACYQRLV